MSDPKKGLTYEVKTGCGPLYVTCNDRDGKTVRTLITLGKSGGCAAAHVSAYSTLITKLLESGLDLDSVIKALSGTSCQVESCCIDGIAQCLRMHEEARPCLSE